MSELNDILGRLDEDATKWIGDQWPGKTAAFIRAQATRLTDAETAMRAAKHALRIHQSHLEHAAVTMIDEWLRAKS